MFRRDKITVSCNRTPFHFQVDVTNQKPQTIRIESFQWLRSAGNENDCGAMGGTVLTIWHVDELWNNGFYIDTILELGHPLKLSGHQVPRWNTSRYPDHGMTRWFSLRHRNLKRKHHSTIHWDWNKKKLTALSLLIQFHSAIINGYHYSNTCSTQRCSSFAGIDIHGGKKNKNNDKDH